MVAFKTSVDVINEIATFFCSFEYMLANHGRVASSHGCCPVFYGPSNVMRSEIGPRQMTTPRPRLTPAQIAPVRKARVREVARHALAGVGLCGAIAAGSVLAAPHLGSPLPPSFSDRLVTAGGPLLTALPSGDDIRTAAVGWTQRFVGHAGAGWSALTAMARPARWAEHMPTTAMNNAQMSAQAAGAGSVPKGMTIAALPATHSPSAGVRIENRHTGKLEDRLPSARRASPFGLAGLAFDTSAPLANPLSNQVRDGQRVAALGAAETSASCDRREVSRTQDVNLWFSPGAAALGPVEKDKLAAIVGILERCALVVLEVTGHAAPSEVRSAAAHDTREAAETDLSERSPKRQAADRTPALDERFRADGERAAAYDLSWARSDAVVAALRSIAPEHVRIVGRGAGTRGALALPGIALDVAAGQVSQRVSFKVLAVAEGRKASDPGAPPSGDASPTAP